MSAYSKVKISLRKSSYKNIVEQLGYNSLTKGTNAINIFLASEDFLGWTQGGYYDFKFDAVGLFKQLCNIFEIDVSEVENEFKNVKILQKELIKHRNDNIFINTNFKRKSEPIFALAISEPKRNIFINTKNIILKEIDEVLKIVSNIVKNHYVWTNGNIGIWGNIASYVYFYQDKIYTFNTKGELINNSKITISRATLSLK